MKCVLTGMAEVASPGTPLPRMRLVIALVAGVLFMEFLDATVIATALPAMAQSFGVSAIDLNIGISAYLIALGVFIPASAWAAERFGTRRIFIASIVIFTGASLLCGLVDGLWPFVAARVLQGMGGAMMVPVGRLVVLKHTPKDKLISAIALLVWPALIAPVIGPALGGFITIYANWRWIFFLNIPLGVVALIAALALIPDSRAAAPRPFDWLGFLLCASGIAFFLCGAELFTGQAVNILLAVALIATGSILLVTAFSYLRRAAAPMLDLGAFKTPTFTAAMRGGSFTRAAIGSAPFLLPLMFQIGFGFDAFESGLLVMAVFAGNLLMKSVTTPILKRFGFRKILVWNGVIGAVWLFACAFLTHNTPATIIVLFLFLGGLTRSLQFTAINTVAFADIPQQEMAHANALFSTIFQLSLGAGVAVGAIAVRLGGALAEMSGMQSPAVEFQIAFILVSMIAILGLIDAIRLARNSGDNISGRSSSQT